MLKTLSIVLFFMLLSGSVKAQYDSQGADLISRFKPGGMWYFTGFRPAQPEKVRKYDRLIFDLTHSEWNGDLNPVQNAWTTIGLNTNLLFDIPLSKGNTVSIGTGLTHSFVKMRNDGIFLSADSTGSFTTLLQNPTTGLYPTKNYLGGNSFSIPLELRFRTKGWKHFKIHLGGRVGYQMNFYQKTVTGNHSSRSVLKDYSLPDVNKLIYSAHVRIGIRNWSLYGSYNLNRLFKSTSSSQLNLFQFGLSVSVF
jgi:hypothetical protein